MARSNKSIYVALLSNIGIAVTKFIAGSASHSSAMISEAIHSLVDCSNELLLLLGIYKSRKKRDQKHPFGYGRELYLWSLIIAILIFGLGAGVSFYQGVSNLNRSALSENLRWNFGVLGVAFVFDGASFLVALKSFNKTQGGQPLWQAIISSKDPSAFLVLLEDFAGVIGVVIVFIGLLLEHYFQNPVFDGIASILIGCLLTFISVILARESRSLLMGEGISAETEKKIRDIVEHMPGTRAVHNLFSVYESPDEVLLVMIVVFEDDLDTKEIEDAILAVKKAIRETFGKINYILIEPYTSQQR